MRGGSIGFVTTIRRNLWLIALVTILALGAGAAYSVLRSPIYRSSMKIVIGQGDGIFLPEAGGAAEQFTLTMSSLLKSQEVAQLVLDEVDADLSPEKLLSHLIVVTRPSTAVVEVAFDNADRSLGLEVLDGVADVFPNLVEERLVPDRQSGSADGRVGANQAVTATVFDPPHEERDPVAPKPILYTGLSGSLGLLAGLVLALVREQLDDTLRVPAEAEAAFGQTATAILPRNFLGYRPFAARDKKQLDPILAELALQKLRASVMWSWSTNQARSMAVTSAASGEGKSTIASNLAVSMAGAGHDVIIVDADLRRPMVHSILGKQPGPQTIGIDALTRGDASIDDALVEIPLRSETRGSAGEDESGRLRAIFAKPNSTWPAEMDLTRAGELIDSLLRRADYVIFDTPPIQVVTDPYPIVAAVDAVLAVTRMGESHLAALEALSKSLARLRVRHVRRGELIITEADAPVKDSYYGYGTKPPVLEDEPQAPPAWRPDGREAPVVGEWEPYESVRILPADDEGTGEVGVSEEQIPDTTGEGGDEEEADSAFPSTDEPSEQTEAHGPEAPAGPYEIPDNDDDLIGPSPGPPPPPPLDSDTDIPEDDQDDGDEIQAR